MNAAGFVLVGGQSRRMGRDKALLPWKSGVLVEEVAARLGQVVDDVSLVGAPERYAHLGFRCLRDLRPGSGPLAGIETALDSWRTEWNLVLACDIPDIDVDHLMRLIERAKQSDAMCLVTADASGAIHPLCAIYRSACLNPIRRALDANKLRLLDVVQQLGAETILYPSPFPNVNTPEEWNSLRAVHVH